MTHRVSRSRSLGQHALLLGCVSITCFPVLYALLISTFDFQQVFIYPPRLIPGMSLLENVGLAWSKVNLGRLLTNSLAISISVALGKTLLSILAAFAFTYFRDFPGKNLLFVVILITHMLPLPVRIVSTFQLMDTLNWVNTYYALTIPFFASATGTLLFRQFFLTVPASLSDAARIDGAGPMRFLTRILLPLSYNNLVALFMVEFVYMWNEYLWPLIVTTSNEMRVAQIGIKMLVATDAQAEWNVIMAGVILVMLPPLVILLLTQNHFMRSVTFGQEK
ncbi:MAG: ABC transporter permease subunit [candidate division NC10 bacterium]|nr:ABC transporter permease subunit [candidate division NC10 bacterium]MBI4840192.1 ABC transporter permease subunit [candidate division NC10 bacterium]